MFQKSFLRFVLLTSSIFLAALFFLVLTINALKTPTTASTTLPEGPYMVKDLNTGETSSFPYPIIPVGDKVFSFAIGDQGRNLWISDGTESGTYQISLKAEQTQEYNSIEEYYDSSDPIMKPTPDPEFLSYYPEVVNNQLFFQNDDGIHGKELWISDGSISGTYMVKDILTGTERSRPRYLTNVKNELIFEADHQLDDSQIFPIFNDSLWMSEGSITNTNMITDITVAYNYRSWENSGEIIINLNGKAYFPADDGKHGMELWTTDGTISGTYMVKDVVPGESSSYPQDFHKIDNLLFFNSNSNLWQSDGTITGTIPVQDTFTGTSFNYLTYRFLSNDSAITTDKSLFFNAYNKENEIDDGLWVSDGTITGTYHIKDPDPTRDSIAYALTSVGERVFFLIEDDIYGFGLWVSDSTPEGTYKIIDIDRCRFYYGSFIYEDYYETMADLNGFLLFAANDMVHGCELWASDGTRAGTYLVHDINPGESSSNPSYLSPLNNTLFFAAADDTHGEELWSLGNAAPFAKEDTAVITMNQAITIPVIDNDFDLNLDAISMVSVTQPTHGTTTMVGQAVVYTPDAAFIGNDAFSYTIQDTAGLTAVAQVNITVTSYRTYLPIVVHQTGDR